MNNLSQSKVYFLELLCVIPNKVCIIRNRNVINHDPGKDSWVGWAKITNETIYLLRGICPTPVHNLSRSQRGFFFGSSSQRLVPNSSPKDW